MLTLNLNIDGKVRKVKLKEELIFNALLVNHPKMIRKLIKSILPFYKIDKSYFAVINKFIDFTDENFSIYPGLIVRTGPIDFAIVYLESAVIDNEYMLKLVSDFIYDLGNFSPNEVNINKFEVSKRDFLHVTRKI